MENKILFRSQSNLPRILATSGLIILCAIAAIMFYSVSNLNDAATWRRHTYIVINEIRSLRADLEATKFEATALHLNSKAPIDNFLAAQKELVQTLTRLRLLVHDNSAQSKRLQDLELALNGKLGTWRTSADSTLDSAEVTSLLREMETAEQNLLLQRTAEVDSSFQMSATVVVAGVGIAFLLFFLSTRLLQKQIILRQKIQAELESARARALEGSNLKSSFLANMSHEIRTPLNGIIGMSKLLEQTPLDARQSDFLETIKTSSTSLLALINEILDLSKIESGKFQLENTNFELSSLIKSAVSIVDYSAKMKNLEIQTEIDSQVPDFLTGDPLRLRQVLLNLINNAIKFSDQGTIKVRVGLKGPDINGIAHLLFEITDQGVGFDNETRGRLFQSFSQGDSSMTRKYGGTGLGLAISKQIIEMMKGSIDVDSVKGVGSRFYFDVPLGRPHHDAEIQRISKLQPVTQLRGHVLIAEDNLINQKVVSEMVASLGCTYRIVQHGKEALTALKNERFDIVLMDAQMPEMDGYEATRCIRSGQGGESNISIPILATTANAIKGDIELCLESGMNDYISKPIAYNDLAIKMGKWMSKGNNVITPGSALHKEVIEIFSQDSPQIISKMRQALKDKKLEQVPLLAHNLKSSAAVLGAIRLRDLCEKIELMDSKTTSEQQFTLLVDSLERELVVAQKTIQDGQS